MNQFVSFLLLSFFIYTPILCMEPTRADKTELAEFEHGLQNYKTAQTFYNNFKIVQEDDYRNALRSYCTAIRQFELASAKKHPLAQQNLQECLAAADPKKWGLQKIPEGIDETLFPESLALYLKKQNTCMPPLPLNLIEEEVRRLSLTGSSKTVSPSSSDRSVLSSASTERSDVTSERESSGRGLRKQISKLFQGKQSPLRASSAEKERRSASPEEPSLLQKSHKMKDLKTLLQEEE